MAKSNAAKKKTDARKGILDFLKKGAEIQGSAGPNAVPGEGCYPDGQAYYSLLWYFEHEIEHDLNPSDEDRYSPLLDAYLGENLPEITHPKKPKKKQSKRIDSLLEEGFPQSEYPLNKAQQEAVRKALTYPISFIQGPPGTGKTEVILRIIGLALERGWSVAVVSANSAAVANVEMKVANAIKYYQSAETGLLQDPDPADLAFLAASKMAKLGNASIRAQATAPITGEALRFEKGNHVFRDGAEISGWEQNKRFDDFVEDFPFITCTIHSLKKCFVDGDERKFDLLIADESSQMNLIAGIVALSCARRAVFVGDVMQLPPVSVDYQMEELTKYARKNKVFKKPEKSPYNMAREDWSFLSSCYEVFVDKNPDLHTMLVDHYRCHPGIIDFCNKEVYDNKLAIHPNDWGRKVPCPIEIRWYCGDYREGIWPKAALEPEENPNKKVRSTYSNEKQLLIMREEEAEYLRKLVKHNKSICMLSPFRGQIYRLQELVKYLVGDLLSDADMQIETVHHNEDGVMRPTASVTPESSNPPVALTIHKSQGQEFDVVYLFPVEDGNWEWPWSQGMRLVNVALSRAKSEVHIILSTKLMSKKRQRELVGKVAWVTKPARKEDDVKNQEMFIRRHVDYVSDLLAGLDAENAEAQLRFSDHMRGGYGIHESAVVSIFDEIPYLQSHGKGRSDSTPELCMEIALAGMNLPIGVAWAKHVTFDSLYFENGRSLADECAERYESPDTAHFDFVFYDANSGRVILAIEVDGPQHRFKKRKGIPVFEQIVMDRKKDGVARDICGAEMARLAYARGEFYVRKNTPRLEIEATIDPTLHVDSSARSPLVDEFTPKVEWILYPSQIRPDASFVFLRIPSNGSTFCEVEALKQQVGQIPAIKSGKRNYPPTIEEYLSKQRRIIANQRSCEKALFLKK